MSRKFIAPALAVLMLAGLAACTPSLGDGSTSPAETTEALPEESVGVPAEEEPTSPGEAGSLTEADAYAQAAANGAEGDRPFSVYRPTWLPDGFVFQGAYLETVTPRGLYCDLSVVYASGSATITVDVSTGDVGDVAPVSRTAWGRQGDCSIYRDAWDDSYIALAPSSAAPTPNVRTVGVSLEDLARVLANLEVVGP